MKRWLIFTTLILLLIISVPIFNSWQLSLFQGRAYLRTVDYDNVYTFCTPSRANGNCQELIRCTIVVLDTRGLPIENKKCHLYGKAGLELSAIRGISDTNGSCIFDISTCTPGKYILQGYIDGKQLQSEVRVSFD